MKSSGSVVYYPAQLDLRGVPVLVVGGGEVAVRKTGSLLEAGAKVRVVAPEMHAGLKALAKQAAFKKRVKLVQRAYRAEDLRGARLVFASTNIEVLNSRIAAAAKARGVWVNVAAPPEAGNFQVPSHFRRGAVTVAISTGGASAALARAMRERLEQALGKEWGVVAELLEARRKRVHAEVPDAGRRRALLLKLGSRAMAARVRRLGRTGAAREMDRLIRSTARNGARA